MKVNMKGIIAFGAMAAVSALTLTGCAGTAGDKTGTDTGADKASSALTVWVDSERVDAIYGGKAVQVQQRPGREILHLVGEQFDVLVLDPQHESSFAATPAWIRRALDGGRTTGR